MHAAFRSLESRDTRPYQDGVHVGPIPVAPHAIGEAIRIQTTEPRLKGEHPQASKPAPVRPGLDRPTLIDTGDARDDNRRDRILANLEGRSARTGMTTRSRRRLAMWSFVALAIGGAAVGGYWYGSITSNPTQVQVVHVQTAPAAQPATTVATNEAGLAASSVTTAETTPALPTAHEAAPAATIENVAPPTATGTPFAAIMPTPGKDAGATPKVEPAVSALPAAAAPSAEAAKPKPAAAKRTTAKAVAAAPTKAQAPDRKKATTVARADDTAAPKAASAAKPAEAKPARRPGQADNDVDLIEALIVHTMPGGDAKASK